MKDKSLQFLDSNLLKDVKESSSGMPLNFKRVLGRALRYWYLILLSIVTALMIAYLINRYTTKIFPVSASIIVREGTENAAAEFLYKSNPLVNPYRNFYNELYIMRSYPLLQEVVEGLNFPVAWYREGNIKTSEIYDHDFPIDFRIVKSKSTPYGKSIGFRVEDQEKFTIESVKANGEVDGEPVSGLLFNDTISFAGSTFFVRRETFLSKDIIGKYFIIRFRDPTVIAHAYANRLKATWAEQGASVVNLDLSGPVPEKEIDFLNKFIERYQQYDVDKKNQVASKSIEFLDTQLANIGDSLELVDNQIESFRASSLQTGDFEKETERLMNRLAELETSRAQLVLFDNYYKYLEGYISNSKEFDQVIPPSSVGINDPVLTEMIARLTEYQFSIRMLGEQQTEENPLVTERRVRIQQLKRDIVEGVKSIKKTQNIQRDFLDKEISKLERELTRIPASERAMIDLKRNYSIRENMYLFLMQKRAEAGISRASTTSDIIVVNPPTIKGGPITPKPAQNYSIALAAGLLFPFAFFLLAEVLNDKVQSKEDIEQVTAIPLIGGIGHNIYGDSNLVVVHKPKSALAEGFRALRSNLNYFTPGKEKKIILITSSVSGEGKTFTTINLASVIAFSGKRVLIIGADMRRPKIFGDFDLQNEKGLSTYLSSMATLDEVIQRTSVDNLYLISGGSVPPNPSELLMSKKTQEMLEALTEKFDYILLDTPPLGLVSDALSLIPFADHTIFMVRQNYTSRYFLKDIQELCDQKGIRNISILFNDIKKTGPGYGYGAGYSYNYGYGYGYGYGYTYGSGKDNGYYSE